MDRPTWAFLRSFQEWAEYYANYERYVHGRQPLIHNVGLAEVSLTYADQMMEGDFFSHEGWKLRNPSFRTGVAGIFSNWVGENNLKLPLDSSRAIDAQHLAWQAIEAWKGSPGHHRVLIYPDLRYHGIALTWGYTQKNHDGSSRSQPALAIWIVHLLTSEPVQEPAVSARLMHTRLPQESDFF